MSRQLAAVVLLGVLAVGCSSAGGGSDDPGGGAAAATAEATEREDVQEAVDAAVRGLRSQRVIGLVASVDFDGLPVILTRGTVIERRTWEMETEVREDETPGLLLTRAAGGQVWAQSSAWGANAGCWIPLRRGSHPYSMRAMTHGESGYTTLLDDIEARAFTDGTRSRVRATVPLGRLLAMVPHHWLATAVGPKVARTPTRVTVDLRDDRLEGIKALRGDVAAALRRANARLAIRAPGALELTITYLPVSDQDRTIAAPGNDEVATSVTSGCGHAA